MRSGSTVSNPLALKVRAVADSLEVLPGAARPGHAQPRRLPELVEGLEVVVEGGSGDAVAEGEADL